MSDLLLPGLRPKKAAAYNAKTAVSLGWLGNLPEGVVADYPKLGMDPTGTSDERRLFAEDVHALQRMLSIDADGLLGRGTLAAIHREYAFVDDDAAYMIQNGIRQAVEADGLLTWEDDGGLDLHRDGGWKKGGGRKPTLIVLHWGGLDAKHCRRVLANRDLSSHFGIDRSGAYQWLDLDHVAWHAGYPNRFSIGIDICQQPSLKWGKWYEQRSYGLTRIGNTTGRGQKRVLSLHPETKRHTLDVLKGLCAILDIPFDVPRDASGALSHAAMPKEAVRAFRGIVGHHHISARKWDVAPWWVDLFGPDGPGPGVA